MSPLAQRRIRARHAADAMSRREFVQRVALASAVIGAGTLPASAATEGTSETALVLAPHWQATLVRLLDHLIPAQGALPPAGALGVNAFIERAMSLAPHLRAAVATVLDALPEPEILARWSGSTWDARVRRIEQKQAASFDVLLQAAYAGYYGHPGVLAALGWSEPADAVSDADGSWFDTTLLNTVRRTGLPSA